MTNGAILVTPVVLRFFASPRAVWERRGAGFLVPILIAVTLTAVAFQIVVRREGQQIRDHFGYSAEAAADLMRQSLVGYVDVLQALAGLFESSEFVTAEEFRTFVQRVLPSYGGILAVEWAPVVRETARTRFEDDLGRGPLRSFPGDGEGFATAGPSKVYVPVRYAEPTAFNERLVGVDLASEPTRRTALFAAARFGSARATPPVKLLEGSLGVMVAVPITAKPGNDKRSIGGWRASSSGSSIHTSSSRTRSPRARACGSSIGHSERTCTVPPDSRSAKTRGTSRATHSLTVNGRFAPLRRRSTSRR